MLTFTTVKKKNTTKFDKSKLFNLIQDFDDLDDDNDIIKNEHESVVKKSKKKKRFIRESFESEDEDNKCKLCRFQEKIIAFYHKIAFIIVICLLFKFILDSIIRR